ncbi:MAG: SPOR domain-containing protein [Alphaproteobacteria bacterium]|nr:SPOR domain-containing protein [Alphaproteobacteria bacterium]MDP6814042.1 SPOR domain-containing protein [Alphaproteobacteria bacterium]
MILAPLALPAHAAGFDELVQRVRAGNYPEARKELLALAKGGHDGAQFQLGLMAHLGRGAPQNYKESRRWYRLAASNGHPAAQNNLGVIYRDGLGTVANKVLAYKWLNLGAAAGNDQAVANLRRLKPSLTAEQILEGQQLAEEYARLRTETRQPKAMAKAAEPPAEAKVAAAPAPKQPAAAAKVENMSKPEQILATIFQQPTYLVQLGLFQNTKNVGKINARLKDMGIELINEDVQVRGANYARLRVGPYNSEDKAHRMAVIMNDTLGIRSSIIPRFN